MHHTIYAISLNINIDLYIIGIRIPVHETPDDDNSSTLDCTRTHSSFGAVNGMTSGTP